MIIIQSILIIHVQNYHINIIPASSTNNTGTVKLQLQASLHSASRYGILNTFDRSIRYDVTGVTIIILYNNMIW